MVVAVAQEPGYARMVGHEFVQRYYNTLHNSTGKAHNYYNDVSMICRPEDDGSMSTTTTKEAINRKILSLKCDKYKKVVLKSMEAHSFNSGVQVRVIGSLIGKDGMMQSFSQSFFLEQKERDCYYVLDDVFRYVENANSHDGHEGSAIDVDVEDAVSDVEDAVSDMEDANSHDGDMGSVSDVEGSVSDVEGSASDVEEALCNPMQGEVVDEVHDDSEMVLKTAIKTEEEPVTGGASASSSLLSGRKVQEDMWTPVVRRGKNKAKKMESLDQSYNSSSANQHSVSSNSLCERDSVLVKRAPQEDERESQSRKISRKESVSTVNTDIIDLHGKTVKQARQIVKRHLKSVSSSGCERSIKVITGRGLHSEGGKPKIKPAVINLLEKAQVVWKGENKGGALLITVDGEREFIFLSSDSDSDRRPPPRAQLSDFFR